MVRKKLIAGNWKMNCLRDEGVSLAKSIATQVKTQKLNCEFLVCPPYTLLGFVNKALRGSKVALGAQDIQPDTKSAHTGDISIPMIKDMGCTYVILGHSERRIGHHEQNTLIHEKASVAHQEGLKTIICIGESAAEHDKDKTIDVCQKQILHSVPADSVSSNTIIAYEPIWAIGTGKTPTPDEIQKVHAAIRVALAKKLGSRIASKIRILYGGSVKPSNAASILSLEDVDGALVGGASLNANDFVAIARNAYK